jgi:hypothetical protein
MKMNPSADNLLLGAGEIYYGPDNLDGDQTDRFFRHLGHCSSFSLQVETIRREIPAIRAKITDLAQSRIVGYRIRGTVVMDEISPINLAGWMAGTCDTSHTQVKTSFTDVDYTVKKNTWVGLTDDNDIRVFGCKLTADVKDGSSNILTPGKDYVFHARAGYFFIPDTSSLVDDDTITVSYDIPDTVINQISIAERAPQPGGFSFIGDPTTGPAYAVMIECVHSTSVSPVSFIGEEFTSVTVEFEAERHEGTKLDGTAGFWQIIELPEAML